MIGRALRNVRAGDRHLLWSSEEARRLPDTIDLTSPDFTDGAALPARFTAAGEGLSPALRWTGVPDRSAALLLVIEDADAPLPRPFIHFAALVAPDVMGLTQGALRKPFGPGILATAKNSFFGTAWEPPSPPAGHGPHHYRFQLYALDARPADLGGRVARKHLIGRAGLARGCITATFEHR